MKRKCKNVDIYNLEFIEHCINKCLEKKGKKIYTRHDVNKYVMKKHGGDIHSVALQMQSEMMNRKLVLVPIRYRKKRDSGNGKMRLIAIEDIKQQFYDYVAYEGLKELDSYIGHYHVALPANQKGKKKNRPDGTLSAAQFVKGWLADGSIRYAAHADVQKCYPSISHEKILEWLERHVKNEPLIWLISQMLATVEKGLPIGSVLSIKLCAFFLADIYHEFEDSFITYRRGKKNNTIKHQLFYADDIFIFGSNARQLHKAMNWLIDFSASKGLTIKIDWQIIDLNPNEKNAHIDVLGYKVYRDRITMRHRNYIKTKQSIRRFKAKPTSVACAKSMMARYGTNLKSTNSTRFCRKYNVYPVIRKARKVISNYDKSKIRYETATS